MIGLLTTAFVTFREGFEALLMTLLVTGMVRSRGLDWLAVAAGLCIGLVTSVALALLLSQLGEDHGLVDAAICGATALTLTYVVIWNARVQAHVRDHVAEIRQQSWAMMVISLAVIFAREGSEMVIMLNGAIRDDAAGAALGGAIGLLFLAAVGWAFSAKLLINGRVGRLFNYSNYMLAAMAIYFYWQTISILREISEQISVL